MGQPCGEYRRSRESLRVVQSLRRDKSSAANPYGFLPRASFIRAIDFQGFLVHAIALHSAAAGLLVRSKNRPKSARSSDPLMALVKKIAGHAVNTHPNPAMNKVSV